MLRTRIVRTYFSNKCIGFTFYFYIIGRANNIYRWRGAGQSGAGRLWSRTAMGQHY